ncbi:MAG: hypothetical protein H7Z14_17125 [Anaerolineae bacterium]|nr:hypothetical protein [Phycisphaerae bacterium]
MMHRLTLIILGVAICYAMVGCKSAAEHTDERRQELLRIYPPGRTTREDVRKKWDEPLPHRPYPSYYAATRPAGGWESFDLPGVRERALNSERRTGQPVASLERYFGPDFHHFFGLNYAWYYYDVADKVVDVDWQFASD